MKNYSWDYFSLADSVRETLHIMHGKNDYYVQVLYKRSTAHLGIWLLKLPREILKEIAQYIFRTHREIHYISYRYSYESLGMSRKANHFKIELPNSVENLMNRLTSKHRYNLKRQLKLLEKEHGAVTCHEYICDWNNENVREALEKFLDFKKITHKQEFGRTGREHVQLAQISNVYVLKSSDKIISVVLSCEQCPCVFLENIAYDSGYKKFGVGIILYNYFLGEIIKKGKQQIFLGDAHDEGQRKYKEYYGSIEEVIYHGIIYRHFYECVLKESVKIFKSCLKKILPQKIIDVIKLWRNK